MTFTAGHSINKGKVLTTDPITNLADMAKVKAVIGHDVRLQALWAVATGTALRVGDLVKLRWSDSVDDGEVITFTVREGKTEKLRKIPLSVGASERLRRWSLVCHSDFIFVGQRGQLAPSTWSGIVKDLCRRAGLEGRFASHSVRKSFVRIHHDEFGTSMATLMTIGNWSSERQVLTYMGKMADDVAKAYSREI
jgi:integrase